MQQEILLQDLTDFRRHHCGIRTLKPEIEVQRRSPRFGVRLCGAELTKAVPACTPTRAEFVVRIEQVGKP